MKVQIKNRSANFRSGQNGAVKITTLLIFAGLLAAAFVLWKVIPVYYQQEKTLHDTEELANKASLGLSAYSKEYVEKRIQEIIQENDLPAGSVSLVSRDQDRTTIAVKYSEPIDFIVTTYNWDVDHTMVGKPGL